MEVTRRKGTKAEITRGIENREFLAQNLQKVRDAIYTDRLLYGILTWRRLFSSMTSPKHSKLYSSLTEKSQIL